jgi:hypothetical protein
MTTHLDTQPNSPSIAGSLSAAQRLDEIAGLLAAGILRLHISQAQAAIAQTKKNHPERENQLDAGARKSVHASRTRV